jgi:hypothetical protein
VKAEVEGLTDSNPNTHFGSVTATYGSTASSTKLTLKNMTSSEMKYHKVGDNISFTRAYRGFEFQGFYLGTENLGKSFTLTEEHEKAITETHPLIAKFTPTEEVTLFYDDDPKSYRIPAIATTGTGRVVAVSDYRHSLDDIGRDVHGTGSLRIDLVMRYSDDNGVTWSKKQTIAEGTDDKSATGYDCAYGDAAIAAVKSNDSSKITGNKAVERGDASVVIESAVSGLSTDATIVNQNFFYAVFVPTDETTYVSCASAKAELKQRLKETMNENEYLRAQVDYLKKLKALMEADEKRKRSGSKPSSH